MKLSFASCNESRTLFHAVKPKDSGGIWDVPVPRTALGFAGVFTRRYRIWRAKRQGSCLMILVKNRPCHLRATG